MNETIVSFNFDGTEIRALDQNGQPWFVLSDVCAVLDISNSRDAASRLDDDEKGSVGITDTSSNGVTQGRTVTTINESGLYSLILTSRKESAKQFKKWVTSEVLPQIRKTGQYTKKQKSKNSQTIEMMRPDSDKLIENYRVVLPNDTYYALQDTITQLQAELIQTQRALLQSQQELLQLKLEYATN